MFNASYFTYDGVFSGTYGLIMADFNDDPVVETTTFSPTLNTVKPVGINRFFHNGIVYEEAPQHQFSIISEAEIPDIIRREILSWLVGRKAFKKLQIHQPDLEAYYYNCVFTNTENIYVNGRCHGFRLTANFNSPYAYGEPTELKLPAGTHDSVFIENKSDIKDEYVYPIVRFKGASIKIINKTDEELCEIERPFTFEGLNGIETITVDNEVKHISTNKINDNHRERLSKFVSKNWLRLLPGRNELKVVATGDVIITCPNYVMIGF